MADNLQHEILFKTSFFFPPLMRSQNDIMINTLFFWLKNMHLKLGGLCIGCIQVLIYQKESKCFW